MQPLLPLTIALLAALVAITSSLYLRWGTRWGSDPNERGAEMPGDGYLAGGPPA